MRFKCEASNVGPNAFVINTVFALGGKGFCFLEDFEEREGYFPVSEKEINMVQDKTRKPWPALKDLAIDKIRTVRKSAIEAVRLDSDEQWCELLMAAKEHRTARYKTSEAPFEIKEYAELNDLRVKASSLEIIAKAEASEQTMEELMTLSTNATRKLKEINDPSEIFKIYSDAINAMETLTK